MKNLLKIFFLLFIFTPLNAQDQLKINLYSGISTLYARQGDLVGVQHRVVDDFIYGSGRVDIANTMGITYESKPFNFWKNQYYFVTEGNISHRWDRIGLFNYLMLTNNIYLPQLDNGKKWNLLFGVRNSVVLSNLKIQGFDGFLFSKRHIWGITSVVEYAITDKMDIGFNIYLDYSPLGTSVIDEFRGVEAMLKLSYRIR